MERRGLIAQLVIAIPLIYGFFQLMDSQTFQKYVLHPLSGRTMSWSADDWNTLASIVIGFGAGVWLIYLVWRGIALGPLRSYWWFAGPIYLILLSAYRHAKWVGWI
jgi:hypothetical protein